MYKQLFLSLALCLFAVSANAHTSACQATNAIDLIALPENPGETQLLQNLVGEYRSVMPGITKVEFYHVDIAPGDDFLFYTFYFDTNKHASDLFWLNNLIDQPIPAWCHGDLERAIALEYKNIKK